MKFETKFDVKPQQPTDVSGFVDRGAYLTKEEKALLKDIVNDKFSIGAFAGMITNLYYDGKAEPKAIAKKLLEIRLMLKRLSEE